MPSSLVVVALVVAWLVVLVPMIVRKRQEVAKTGDSELAARVVRSGTSEAELDTEEAAVAQDDEIREDSAQDLVAEVTDASEAVADDDADHDDMSYYDDGYPRRYRPGRGGFDPEAAAVIARAKYAFRQRVVLAMIVGAIITGVCAGVVFAQLWWAHGFIDLVLVSYLGYLRRQVRIEDEIRERRLFRMQRVRRAQAAQAAAQAEAYARAAQYVEEPAHEPRTVEEYVEEIYQHDEPARRERVVDAPPVPPVYRGSAVVVDVDDEDPAFENLEDPGNLPYRRAVGE
ncbi:gephyrin-like molybdotransferase receptor GlpR [Actinophytocola sp.]|uniref:divisome protein SepX/GlpR n=1 Tax=Actinophytocola sp. TaxID=1872138 RepID=UPI002D545730|nr:gephyrin-like molybdotransferase receptor GlpR [Actinophytocola sp.]HYQ62752.1 gephyrin-like molybdotransferase receptor GlpR [Actinophytocola sp.]